MSGYKVKMNFLFFSYPVSSVFLFLVKRTRHSCLLLSLCFCLLPAQKAAAQEDTLSGSVDEEVTDDTTNTENGFDTTGYYFNWKENESEAFTTQKFGSRVSSDTTIQKLRNEDDFWYVKSVEKFKKDAERLRYDRKYRDSLSKAGLIPPDEQDFTEEPTGNEWYLQPWFSNLIWITIVSIFVAAVIYFLLSNRINFFSRKAANAHSEEATAEDDLHNASHDSLLAKYIAQNNYRLAVRVLYLQLLKMLSERSIISYQPQFTNTHYLQQLSATSLYGDFFKVTRYYEYIWYGEFPVSEDTFRKVSNDFANMKKEVLRK